MLLSAHPVYVQAISIKSLQLNPSTSIWTQAAALENNLVHKPAEYSNISPVTCFLIHLTAEMSTSGSNNTASDDNEKFQKELNAEIDRVAVPMLLGVGGLLLILGACFWIQNHIATRRARKSDNDIELQRRSSPEPQDAPASLEPAPALLYLNQDQATRVTTPPQSYSSTSIRSYFKRG